MIINHIPKKNKILEINLNLKVISIDILNILIKSNLNFIVPWSVYLNIFTLEIRIKLFKICALIKGRNDTLKINKVLIWSKIKTKFIDQFIRFKILNSKKMISDFVNKKIIKYKDKIIINIRNHKKLLIKALWNFNI